MQRKQKQQQKFYVKIKVTDIGFRLRQTILSVKHFIRLKQKYDRALDHLTESFMV